MVAANQRPPPRRLQRAIAVALGVVASVIAILIIVALIRWQHEPAYAMPIAVLVIAAICVLLTMAGATLAMRNRQPLIPWLTLLTTLLFVAAFLTMFSYGIAFLTLAVISLVARLRLSRSRPLLSWRTRVGGGLLLSLGFAPLGTLATQGPVVSCMQGGTSNSTPVWTWFSGGGLGMSGSSGGSSTSDQVSGTVTIGRTHYSYTCAGSRLVRFST